MRQFGPFACSLAAFALAQPALAQAQADDTVEAKLAYVASVYPDRTYFCRVLPRTSDTSETLITIDFIFEEAGPIDAQVVVTGQVRGRRYSARMTYAGRAGASPANPEEAEIVLDTINDYDADPLPDGATWSSPEGDVITLKIDRYRAIGSQPYILVGTQDTELGINDLRCLDGSKNAQRGR